MKYIIFALLICLSSSNVFAQTKVSAKEAFAILSKKAKKVQLLDVRTNKEFESKHIKNAIHANWNNESQFEQALAQLDKKKPVYVYCLSGGRSTKATKVLADKGFEVFEVDGGIMQWEAANLPLINLDNKIAGLTLKEYKKLIKNYPIVLVDFYAEWCGPCKEMEPTIHQIAQTHKENVKVLKINTDENSTLTRQLGITSIPTLYIYKNGKQTWSKTGISDLQTIEQKLK